jgi:aryl-alcohol dehydrogenase-like predicted oxidoreductase
MRVSEVSLGAWLTYGGDVEAQKSTEIIHAALERKINFIDTADVYARGEAEKVVGQALAEDQFARKDLIVSSKVFWPMSEDPNDKGLSRKHIMDSIYGTLDRLQLDYLDIYYCHRYDWQTPLRETVEAMDDLVRDGLVRYWGTSVWSAAQLERAVGIAKEIGARLPAVEQPRYNLIDREIEREVMYTAKLHGIGITPWSPLEQGILTGKYNDGIPEDSRAAKRDHLHDRIEENREKVIKLTEIAKEKDITMAQLALAWILRRDEITSVITGATKISQVEDNIKAVDIELDKDTLDRIEEIMDNKPSLHPVYQEALKDR